MTTLAIILVSLPVILFAYSYGLYPAILWCWAKIRGRTAAPNAAFREWPAVTVVLPAYNEERQIAGAIEALLAQDYPKRLLQVLVVSDASTDATDDIVRGFAPRGIELVRMPTRGGKTAAENEACAHVRGEIVVNTDASIRLHSAAVRQLVARLDDPTVGVASGRDVSVAAMDASANTMEAGYVQFEMRLRSMETRTGGIVGASGCCYAIRTALHRLPIPSDLSRDFSAPLTAREHGYSAVSVDDAIAYVPRTPSLRREYVRKVRTISRGMETLFRVRAMLDPMRYGSFAWKLISHKVCRWLVPITAVPAAVGLLMLATTHAWAAAVGVAGLLGLLIAAVGALWPPARKLPKLISVVSFGVAANLAVLHAGVRLLQAREDKVWEPTRRDVIPSV